MTTAHGDSGDMSAHELAELKRNARAASRFLKCIANRNRLLILCQLVEGEKCVGELEAALELRQPSLSQQLARLREDDLVSARRESKNVYYSIADPNARAMLELLCDLFAAKPGRQQTLLAAE
jgi:DNA-binding transcriptional ArsR family regulator